MICSCTNAQKIMTSLSVIARICCYMSHKTLVEYGHKTARLGKYGRTAGPSVAGVTGHDRVYLDVPARSGGSFGCLRPGHCYISELL